MSDDTTTLDPSAPEAPASTEVETQVAATEDQDLEASEEDSPSEDEDLDELDFEGEKYRIPKKLKPGFMMQADYTRKTQEVAATRQELEAKAKAIEEQAKTVSEINEDRKKLILIDARLEQYNKVNWNDYFEREPLEAPKHFAAYQQLQNHRGTVEASLKSNEAKRSEAAASERNNRLQEVERAVKSIPGWNAETAAKVEAFGHSLGLSTQQMDQGVEMLGAAFVKALHGAFLADQRVKSAAQAAKPAPVNPEPVKPLATVTKAKPAPVKAGLHDDLSADEWVKRREAQLRKR